MIGKTLLFRLVFLMALLLSVFPLMQAHAQAEATALPAADDAAIGGDSLYEAAPTATRPPNPFADVVVTLEAVSPLDENTSAAEATDVPAAPAANITNNYFVGDDSSGNDTSDTPAPVPDSDIVVDRDLGALFGILLFLYGVVRGVIAWRTTGSIDRLVKSLENANARFVAMAEHAYDHADEAGKRLIDTVKSGVKFIDSQDIPGLDPLARAGAKLLDDITDGEPETTGSTASGVGIAAQPLYSDGASLMIEIARLRERETQLNAELERRIAEAQN